MTCSFLHYYYLPTCISASFNAILAFSFLQTACTGACALVFRRMRPKSTCVHETSLHPRIAQKFSLYAGASFALATTLTNYSVASGSVASSRMVKSLEPAIAAFFQAIVHMSVHAATPWIFLLAYAVGIMLSVEPRGLTVSSGLAALCSSAGISARNLFVKMYMQANTRALCLSKDDMHGRAAGRSVEADLNWIAAGLLLGGLLLTIACNGPRAISAALQFLMSRWDHVLIAITSFAVFQAAALYVLEKATPTRQSAIKSLQNAVLTAVAVLADAHRSTASDLMQLIPAFTWAICVSAISLEVSVTFLTGPEVGSDENYSDWKRRVLSTCWSFLFFTCSIALVIQTAIMFSMYLATIMEMR